MISQHARAILKFSLLTCFILNLIGCAGTSNGGGTTTGNPFSEDTSVSGAAAGAVGGALNGSSSSASDAAADALELSPAARFTPAHVLAASPTDKSVNTCSTYHTATGSGCVASGSTAWLTDNQCTSSGSNSKTGTIASIMSSGTATCGTFPSPGANGTLFRQYVTAASSTTPGTFSITNSFGTVDIIDNRSSNLKNFDGVTIAPLVNGGYGSSVTFDGSGLRSGITVAQRTVAVAKYDHTVTGSLSISEAVGATSRTLNGTIRTYDNGLQIISSTVFKDVQYLDTCCLPVAGTITSTFSAGSTVSPTALGQLAVGASETLTISGCGTATLKSYDGSTKNVSLARCF